MMWIIYLSLSLFVIEVCFSQNILDQMVTDNRISKFVKIINSNNNLKDAIAKDYICIFAPSDEAMTTDTGNPEDFVKRHIFESKTKSYSPIRGVVENWSQYDAYLSKEGSVYHLLSLQGMQIFMSNTTTSIPMVNGAQVMAKDNVKNNQVYHIIDRVLSSGTGLSFQETITTTYPASSTWWTNLKAMSYKVSFKAVSNFMPEILATTTFLTGTFFVPNNEAWATLTDADKKKLEDPRELSNVLARMYVSNMLVLVHDKPILFKAGFTANPTTYGDGNVDGSYFRESGVDMVNVQGYSARILLANIPFFGGIIHVIDSPLTRMETRDSYLQKYAKTFLAEIMNYPELKALFGANNTVLAADEDTMVAITKMDNVTKKQTLLNNFILGAVKMATSNNLVLSTAGNATVRVKMVEGQVFLDTVSSLDEKTYMSRATVVRPEQMVDGAVIMVIRGTISMTPQSCLDMLVALDRRAYKTFVDTLPIMIQLGSPYTLFVPSDSSLSELTNVMSRFNESGGSGGVTFSSTTGGVTFSSTTGGNTSISTTTINSRSTATAKPVANMRYLLQRMIVANRLILAKKSTGSFLAATMNFAAMQEKLDMEITSDSVSIGIYGEKVTRPSLDDGFLCSSNTPASVDRLNLLYPVSAVLVTAKDSSISICVTAPCAGCVLTCTRTLLLALGLLSLLYRRA